MKRIRLDGVRVLFVDDRRDARFVVRHILSDAGADVTTLENGRQAVEIVTKAAPDHFQQFDVAVLDINMPVMDGLTAARRLRMEGYRLPILALTSGTLEADRDACLAAGCDEYLRKPINGERLVELVHDLAQASSGTLSEGA